ncbi:MAG: nicotinamide riboside transporter PnuC [Deltaproteobacteria bacterium]|jgi:nicotinamide mononucleotide transporter|nr:nicotinamide riboside transporter PnuC [Deltaproteobacteria bacterium]
MTADNAALQKEASFHIKIFRAAAPYLIFNWKPFEIIWLILFGTVAVALTVFYDSGFFAFTVYLAGIICVVLAAKGHILNYVIGLYNCFGYGYLSYANGLYGEMCLNFFFFVPMAIVGMMVWKRSLKKERVRMRALSPRHLAELVFLIALAVLAGGWCLSLIEGQNTPYLDSATNALSISATFLMTWRYKEQWFAYIALDVLTIAMWFYRALAGSPEGILMVSMWTAYLINAAYGYRVWSVGAREDAEDMETSS